jgi:DNA mismatch repair protein PMS2
LWVSYAYRRRQPLELTASDELLAMENIEVLRQNGFEIEIDEAAAGQGSRLHLAAKPTSGSTDFDMKGRLSSMRSQLMSNLLI